MISIKQTLEIEISRKKFLKQETMTKSKEIIRKPTASAESVSRLLLTNILISQRESFSLKFFTRKSQIQISNLHVCKAKVSQKKANVEIKVKLKEFFVVVSSGSRSMWQ